MGLEDGRKIVKLCLGGEYWAIIGIFLMEVRVGSRFDCQIYKYCALPY